MKKITLISLLILVSIVNFVYAGVKAEKQKDSKIANGEYASPAWMDNEHIICVKYVDTVKSRLFGWFGDISDARFIITKQEIQIVSMDINGENEKVIKSIVIDYPGQSPKWREKEYQWVRMIAGAPNYNPTKQLIAFASNEGRVFIINLNGKLIKSIEKAVSARWSPDGKELLFTSTGPSIWIWDTTIDKCYQLIDKALQGVWSPDGEKMFFSRKIDRYYNVFLYDFETKQDAPFEALNKQNVEIIEDWSPDGTMIAAMQGGIYTLDGNSYSRGMEHLPYTIHWSPDGKHIVGDAGEKDDIWILNSDGSNLKALR